MKNLIFIVLLTLICCSQKHEKSGNDQRIENLKTFAKVYGYVKYFHPSDEAAEIDWTTFVIYGADKVEKCKSKEDLVATLQILFEPIAPSIKFKADSELAKFDLKSLTPKDLKGYLPTYWQHSGVETGMASQYKAPYNSSRVNGTIKKDYFNVVSKITMSISAANNKNKKVKYKAFAKTGDSDEAKGYLRLATKKADGTSDLKRAKIIGNQWKQYELIENIDSLATTIDIGFAMKGKGTMSLDEVQLFFESDNKWIEIPIPNNGFENGTLLSEEQQGEWYSEGVGYAHEVISSEAHEGRKSARMKYTGVITEEKGQPLFDYKPEFGELIKKEIGDDIYCEIPLVLYSNDTGTFPLADKKKFKSLKDDLEQIENKSTNPAVRVGNVINTFNVFQHFYPYMDVVDVNWNQELEKALARCFKDVTEKDHLLTLQKFTAPLKDGHISVSLNRDKEYSTPSITWEWIEDKLVVTKVFNDRVPLKVGDVVTQIDGLSSEVYFEEVYSRISAGTVGFLNHRAQQLSLMGKKDSEISITSNGKKVKLIRNSYPHGPSGRQSDFEKINDSVCYLNINQIPMDEIEKLLPELEKAKSIICDLRVYPNRNSNFLSYLLKENDTTSSWMQVPQNVYPDGDNVVGMRKFNWMLPSKKPYLGDKQIIFITAGSAISYAESYMGFVHGYKLATIVGQPTAGTNGNVNRFELSDGFSITWTGMKVTKHDGSQLHTIGFTPDIYVNKTIKGVKEGRDEFLEKAIELTKQKISIPLNRDVEIQNPVLEVQINDSLQ